MQERMAEIKAQRESLSIQKRVALNESSELRTIISERKNRIQQLRAKYDNNNALIGINPKDGQPLTSTYLQIQNAQEKYLLQEHGDELDRTIRKSECEIESMENTLRVVKTCNDKYKSSLDHVDENGPEKMEQKKLEEEIYNIIEKKKQIRNNFEEKQKDLKVKFFNLLNITYFLFFFILLCSKNINCYFFIYLNESSKIKLLKFLFYKIFILSNFKLTELLFA